VAARRLARKRPQAVQDLVDIAAYLAEESGNDELGWRFLDAAEEALRHLAEMPGLGVTRQYNDPDLAGVRMWRVAGFPNHLIFYREVESGVDVIRVLHASRDIDAIFGAKNSSDD